MAVYIHIRLVSVSPFLPPLPSDVDIRRMESLPSALLTSTSRWSRVGKRTEAAALEGAAAEAKL